MNVTVVMPALGESVVEGTVTRWLKSPGDYVTIGEPLLEVSTDKVDTAIDAPCSGVLGSITVPQDATVAVGGALALIVESAENASVATPTPGGMSSLPPSRRTSFMTPAVRALVRTRRVDITTLVGTGRGGRVTRRDILVALAADAAPEKAPAPAHPTACAASPPTPIRKPPSATSPASRTERLPHLRGTVATHMVESLRVSAQLTTVVEVDFTRIEALRAEHTRAGGSRPSVLPFVAAATCRTLAAHPVLNATFDTATELVTYHDVVNLGIAVDTKQGLLVPVISSASDLNVEGLEHRINDVASRSRDSRVSAEELSGGTFTITNSGSTGVLFDTPIINQPQVAILGVGRVTRRPVVVTLDSGQEVLAVRPMVYLALTYDHRLIDGAEAARFLTALTRAIESVRD